MKFKKQISFILALFLLVSNSGLAFNVHFCEGNIASVSSVFSKSKKEVCEKPIETKQKNCCAKKVKSHKSCCKDKLVNLQDTADDIVIKTFSFQLDIPFLIAEWKPIIFSPVSYSNKNIHSSYYCDGNAPPLFKLYRQYIFYA